MSMAPETRDNAPGFVAGTVLDDDAPEVARSYSEALLNAAGGEAEAVLGDIEAILAEVLDANPKLDAILASPAVRPAEKDRMLLDLFEGKAQPVAVRFLRVLNRNGRLAHLRSIARRARAAWDRRQNRQTVSVRSAVPLDDGQVAALRDRLARLLGAEPQIKAEVDPSLIGGLVIQAGDDVYDASVRNRLEQLRRRLTEGKSHGKIPS